MKLKSTYAMRIILLYVLQVAAIFIFMYFFIGRSDRNAAQLQNRLKESGMASEQVYLVTKGFEDSNRSTEQFITSLALVLTAINAGIVGLTEVSIKKELREKSE